MCVNVRLYNDSFIYSASLSISKEEIEKLTYVRPQTVGNENSQWDICVVNKCILFSDWSCKSNTWDQTQLGFEIIVLY